MPSRFKKSAPEFEALVEHFVQIVPFGKWLSVARFEIFDDLNLIAVGDRLRPGTDVRSDSTNIFFAQFLSSKIYVKPLIQFIFILLFLISFFES